MIRTILAATALSLAAMLLIRMLWVEVTQPEL